MLEAQTLGKSIGRPRVAVDLEHIRVLRARGLSFAAIGRKLGVGATTVQRAVAV